MLRLHAWRSGRAHVVHGGPRVARPHEHLGRCTQRPGADPESPRAARRLAVTTAGIDLPTVLLNTRYATPLRIRRHSRAAHHRAPPPALPACPTAGHRA